jgi:hypothetical protein
MVAIVAIVGASPGRGGRVAKNARGQETLATLAVQGGAR